MCTFEYFTLILTSNVHPCASSVYLVRDQRELCNILTIQVLLKLIAMCFEMSESEVGCSCFCSIIYSFWFSRKVEGHAA